jgi:beta-lactamase class A
MNLIYKQKKALFTFFAIVLIAVTAIAALVLYTDYKKESARWAGLKDTILAQTEGFKGTAHIVIKDYNSNRRIEIYSDTKVPAASIIKIPIMAAIFTAQEQGRLSVSDRLKLKHRHKAGGSGALKNQVAGKEYTVEQLIELMITISDNTATNILIEVLGFDYLNNWFRDNGLKDTILLRLMMDMVSRDKGIENYTTANDIACVLDIIYRNRLIDKDISSGCMRILKQQKTRNRIPAKLPAATVVAHKTGLERAICHDAGIVFTENGDFLISVLTTHRYKNSYQSRRLISDIAYTVYKYYMSA